MSKSQSPSPSDPLRHIRFDEPQPPKGLGIVVFVVVVAAAGLAGMLDYRDAQMRLCSAHSQDYSPELDKCVEPARPIARKERANGTR